MTTQLLGPDANSRLVYRIVGTDIRSSAGRAALIYSDSAGTTLASINTYDGTATPAAVVSGSQLTVDSYSRLPLFWFPAGVDTLYARVDSGPIVAINADYDARVDLTVSRINGGMESVKTATTASTHTINLADGNTHFLTLGAATTTVAFTGLTNGVSCSWSVYFKQDATGSRLVAHPASVLWAGGTAPTFSTGANKVDLVTYESVDGGATIFGALAGLDFR